MACLEAARRPNREAPNNKSGSQVVDMGATADAARADFSPFSQAVTACLKYNFAPNAVVYSPRTWGEVDRLLDTTDQPLAPPKSYADLAKYPTNQIGNAFSHGTATDAGIAIIGDWKNLLMGVRTRLVLETTRVSGDSDSSVFTNMQIWIRGYLRSDFQVARPKAFTVIKGIIPPS